MPRTSRDPNHGFSCPPGARALRRSSFLRPAAVCLPISVAAGQAVNFPVALVVVVVVFVSHDVAVVCSDSATRVISRPVSARFCVRCSARARGDLPVCRRWRGTRDVVDITPCRRQQADGKWNSSHKDGMGDARNEVEYPNQAEHDSESTKVCPIKCFASAETK